MTPIEVEAYTDDYGNRLALRYPYSPETNAILKDVLPFPQFKWDADKRAWSVQDNQVTINKAIEVLERMDYNCTALISRTKQLPETTRGNSECWTRLSEGLLYLHWPYIPDNAFRDKVRLIVRSISGRKFHKEQKCWSIPSTQARTLHSLLEDVYPCLANAIIDNEDVKEDVEGSIERVEMSGAALLDDSKMDEISKKLEGAFPEGLELFPFQKVAVAFAEASDGRCLIGDEMGIGKTISAIGYAAANPEMRPAIVVCPANVKYNWVKEVSKWLPSEDVYAIAKGKDEVRSADWIVINYDLVTKKLDELRAVNAQLIVLDEVHYLKNRGSKNNPVKRTVSTLELAKYIPQILALSGTAISSRPSEFFNTLNLIRPAQFSSFWNFAQRYCDPWHNGYAWNFDGASNIKELNGLTRDMCIRRLKKEVLPELPPKRRTFLPIHLDRKERRPYDLAQEEWDRRIDDYYLNNQPMPQGMMLNMLNDLRHICGRIKVKYASEWIQEYNEQTGRPIVVFTHHRDVMNNLGMRLKDGLVVDTISGDVSSKQRQEIVDNFQDNEIDVLICNTIAAKEGITLTAADTVLFLEREWVPTDEEQAEDRVYRIGQESDSVHAVYISCAGTIDEHFDRVVESKRKVVKAVLDGGDTEERQGLVSELVKKLQTERGWKLEGNE